MAWKVLFPGREFPPIDCRGLHRRERFGSADYRLCRPWAEAIRRQLAEG